MGTMASTFKVWLLFSLRIFVGSGSYFLCFGILVDDGSFRNGSRKHHQQSSCVVLHTALDTVVDNIHEINPVLFIFSGHSCVSFVGNVVECLSEREKSLCEQSIEGGGQKKAGFRRGDAPLQRSQNRRDFLVLHGQGNHLFRSQPRLWQCSSRWIHSWYYYYYKFVCSSELRSKNNDKTQTVPKRSMAHRSLNGVTRMSRLVRWYISMKHDQWLWQLEKVPFLLGPFC